MQDRIREQLVIHQGGRMTVLGWIAFIAGVLAASAALAMCGGCCNIVERCTDSGGLRNGSPYVCTSHPYYCTVAVWEDCICAPWSTVSGPDAIWPAIATVTWPFWIVDEVCEVVLDTVFLPVDGIYAISKE